MKHYKQNSLLFSMFYTNQETALPGGRTAVMAADALFRCEFSSAMPRMGKVLGWWLIFHPRKYHSFEIPFFVSFWEAGKKNIKSLCIGERFFSFLVTLWASGGQSNKAVIFLLGRGVTQNPCSHLFRLEKALKIIKSNCKSNTAKPTTKSHP